MKKLTIKEQADKLYEGWSSIDKLYDEYAKSVGMTYTSLEVLETIYGNPEICTQKFICEQTHNTKQSVNMIIKSFMNNGLVILKELPYDRRNKLVQLSPKGLEYADRIVGTLSNITIRALANFTDDQRSSFLELLRLYVISFEDEIKGKSEDKLS